MKIRKIEFETNFKNFIHRLCEENIPYQFEELKNIHIQQYPFLIIYKEPDGYPQKYNFEFIIIYDLDKYEEY